MEAQLGMGIVHFSVMFSFAKYSSFLTASGPGKAPLVFKALQGMTPQQMYELDEEGGPRCSCMMCIFLSPPNLKNNSEIPQNKAQFDRIEAIEDRTGHFFRPGLSIRRIRSGIYQPDESLGLTSQAQAAGQIGLKTRSGAGSEAGQGSSVKKSKPKLQAQGQSFANHTEQRLYHKQTFLW